MPIKDPNVKNGIRAYIKHFHIKLPFVRYERRRNAGLGMRSFQKNATFLRSFALFIKNTAFFAFFCVLYKRTRRSLRSFAFFIKERRILCVLLRSLCKNPVFFSFYCVLYKRMRRSKRAFWFYKS